MSVIQILLVGIALATAGVDGAAYSGEACNGDGNISADCVFGPSCVTDYGQYASVGEPGVCSTSIGAVCDESVICTAKPGDAEQECQAEQCQVKVDDSADESEPATCEKGWIRVSSCSDDKDAVCVQMQRPIKFISWFHMAYECDAIGGFLPEPSTTGLNQQFNLLLKGYEQLYGETMLFLGASDLTHKGEWKWQNGKSTISEPVWDKEPTSDENLDCMAKVSTSSEKYTAINCEADSMETQVAFMCMRKMK